jgi:4-amino-4-deoxy-L-arabinose transferase-like glycosyltransferase
VNRYFVFAILVLITLLTLFPRSVELINRNYLFGFDQGREYLAAREIVQDHKIRLIGTEIGAGSAGITGIFHGPAYYYLLSIPYFIFDGDPYGGMIYIWSMGVLTVILCFILNKSVFNTNIALLGALLSAISPPLISQSRFLWSPNPLSPFILLAFFFLYRFINSKKTLDLFLAGFFSGFIYNFELAIAIPMTLTLIFFLLTQKELRSLKTLLISIVATLISYSPAIIFELRHKLAINGLIKYLITDTKVSTSQKSTFSYLQDHFNAFIGSFADTFPDRGVLPEVTVAFLLFSFFLYFFFKEKNKKLKSFLLYLLMLPLVSYFVFSFLRNSVYHYYLTHLNFVCIIFFLYIFYSISKTKKSVLKVAMILIILLLSLIAVSNAIKTTKYDLKDYGGTAKIKGLTDAIDYIYKDAKGDEFGLLVFAPPIYTYQYDYMLKWHGYKKYGYVPHSNKSGVFYLLIEPDPQKEWSYKGWLETVIKTGEIKSEVKLPSGFIIQKRFDK